MPGGPGDSAPCHSHFRIKSQATAFTHVLLWPCDVTIGSQARIYRNPPSSTSATEHLWVRPVGPQQICSIDFPAPLKFFMQELWLSLYFSEEEEIRICM